MRPRAWIATAAAALALTHALAHRPAAIVRTGAREAHPHRARGAIHVHTGRSNDGSGDVETVAREARGAGLDFVVLTDHNTAASLGLDGYRHGVLVLGGLEKSTDGGHALVLGLEALPFRLDGDPASVARDATDLGGFVVAAHPASPQPEGRWSAGFDGVTGLECLNLAEPGAWPAGRAALLLPLARYAFDPQGALLRTLHFSRAALGVWDRALAERPFPATLGSDAHGGLPSHEAIFRLASQHLLLEQALSGDWRRDRALVLDAIRRGHGYVAIDSLAAASGFLFEARSGGRVGGMGDDVPLVGEAEIRAEADAPAGTSLVLLRDGAAIVRGGRIVHRTQEPGVYRVEAWLDPALVPGRNTLPWILSNPVYVFDAASLRARAERAARVPPLDPPLPSRIEPLDAFEGPALAARWRIDRAPDASARATLDQGALRFSFELGPGPSTHASVCDWSERDLSGFGALAFRVRGDRRLRFDVQVRVADPAGPAVVRIWRRSVRAELGWRPVAVPFADLRTYDRRGGRPELARVTGVYFHVDEAHLPPGSRGTLWIDDVGLGR